MEGRGGEKKRGKVCLENLIAQGKRIKSSEDTTVVPYSSAYSTSKEKNAFSHYLLRGRLRFEQF